MADFEFQIGELPSVTESFSNVKPPPFKDGRITSPTGNLQSSISNLGCQSSLSPLKFLPQNVKEILVGRFNQLDRAARLANQDAVFTFQGKSHLPVHSEIH